MGKADKSNKLNAVIWDGEIPKILIDEKDPSSLAKENKSAWSQLRLLACHTSHFASQLHK